MSFLTEQQVVDLMKERGYSKTYDKGTNVVGFSKTADDIKINAEVKVGSDQIELFYAALPLYVRFNTIPFDINHKDFDLIEKTLVASAAAALNLNVEETLEKIMEKKTPAPKEDLKERKAKFWAEIAAYGKEKGYTKEMCSEFHDYWCAMNTGGKKMRFEIEKQRGGVFDVKGRLRTWKSNEEKFNSKFKDRTEKKAEQQDKKLTERKQTVDHNKLF